MGRKWWWWQFGALLSQPVFAQIQGKKHEKTGKIDARVDLTPDSRDLLAFWVLETAQNNREELGRYQRKVQ
jgi:hypothetical protein